MTETPQKALFAEQEQITPIHLLEAHGDVELADLKFALANTTAWKTGSDPATAKWAADTEPRLSAAINRRQAEASAKIAKNPELIELQGFPDIVALQSPAPITRIVK